MQISKGIKQVLFWAPRILGICFAVFLSLFALDVFGQGRGFRDTTVALFMHLVPVYLVVIVLAIAWRREWVGAALFPALALTYIISMWGRFHWSAYLGIAGPLFLLGALFGASWILKRQLMAGSQGPLPEEFILHKED